MGDPTRGYEPSDPGEHPFVEEIKRRASLASEKVRAKAEEYIPRMSRDPDEGPEIWLEERRNDFLNLIDDPDDPCGGGNYQGWTSEEMRQLYFVLYGETVDE